MTQEVAAKFQINYQQILDCDGKLVDKLPEFAAETDNLIKLCQWMIQTRLFDQKAVALQRTGKLGTYPSTLGQEAIGVGIGTAMRQTDIFCPYYREYGAQFIRGVKMAEILAYWGGDASGSNYAAASVKDDFPICIPIASQTLHAVGVATAIKLRGEQNKAVVTAIGDGGTSRGDFYEALNVAGVWKLPIVFVINNNQWAISVPREKQTAAKTLAQKALAAGISNAWQIDGNDVISVCQAVLTGLKIADTDNLPSVIEMLTYRMCDHTTADDASRYRYSKFVEKQKKYDPIDRLKKYLLAEDIWPAAAQEKFEKECAALIETAVANYLAKPELTPAQMFDYLYATLPVPLQWQRDSLL